MRIRRQRLLQVALGVAIWSAALTVQAALIFDGLQHHTIEVLRQGRVVASVAISPGAVLQIDADSVSHDKDKKVATFRGKAIARVKLADEVVLSISADEMRVGPPK